MAPPRALRADAARNRTNILAAARERITLQGPAAGMDEIAAAAGVAVGTLYRHFPTKTELVQAVIAEYVEQVADAADAALERARSGGRALDQLCALLQRVVEDSASDQAVKAAAHALGATAGHPPAETRAGVALSELILLAQNAGDVRTDVKLADLYLLFGTSPTDRPAEDRTRWLELALRALTTSS